MPTPDPQQPAADAPPAETATRPTTTEVGFSYAAESGLTTAEDGARLALFGDLHRAPVRFAARIKRPLRFREALRALHDVVGSDYRYVPKDRTAYQAFRRMRQQSAGMGAWQAQQEYFGWLLRNDPLAFFILDPVVTVHPDQVLFEVFSKDEGAYAALSFPTDAFAPEIDASNVEGTKAEAKSDSKKSGAKKSDAKSQPAEPTFGTTNIDFSELLLHGVQRMRSWRGTTLAIGQGEVALKTDGQPGALEKKIRVPDSWIRGFLQVQSAATLPRDVFTISPIDLYNALRHLRMHADQKKKRRGMRVELVPGEPPRLVLEPWEKVVTASAGKYSGTQSKVVRVWGRRRLMLLRRLLPFLETIEVHLLGSGLPAFWILRGEGFTFTLGLSGFTSADWSQAAAFDLLMPRKTQDSKELEKVVQHLAKVWKDDEAGLGKATKLSGAALTEALQLGCQQGQLMYDLAAGVYRLRPLTDVPLDLKKLEYRNDREKQAHDLLTRKGAVTIVSENRIHGTGLELTGKVLVAEDKREYRPQLLLADDGRVLKAECTCPFHRQHGLKQGPAATLIALRLAYVQLERQRKADAKAQHLITMETRTFSRRRADGEEIVQIALDRQRLRLKWGRAGEELRSQQFQFGTVDAAREEYLARLNDLTSKGYLDASA